ncbi:anthranilate phosphoribosyltransferase [Cokeromyces recurvatus]|uniref:anthranilate phosphoribosyltransferase n=1 Tax=Cokeromyces recurvatus TaxID=90255 RepID=UPI002220A382|nr:anthranilate phosphoribosyltransferase [Cokeromyces recurvatus]KAI7900104.1 anthranilate phosphoribosyltransferase [Cokeromyces recurvatus]
MKTIIKKLVHEPTQFSPEDAERAMHQIMQGSATSSQISAFLISLKLQEKDKDPQVVAACATAMRSHACLVPYDHHPQLVGQVVDIVGTGGDGHDTYNVSTTASIVAAGAGAKVAKHGNRAASSRSGSADLMEAHGCAITQVEPYQHVAKLRKEIAVPTVFNLLGPMSNPAKPSRMVVGVHSPEIGALMANALRLTGVQEGLVVCGAEGLDEISPAGETHYWRIDGNDIKTGRTYPLSQVKGGDCHENAHILNQLLNNQLSDEDPILNFVLLNTSALLVMAGIASDFKEGVEKARESIKSGNAKRVLESFRDETRKEKR